MAPKSSAAPRHGLARVLSKQGVCSRTEAARWIVAGRVAVDGRVVRDPEFPIAGDRKRISVDGQPISAGQRCYLMLNKPRGVVTTASDEQGRDTVYRCLQGHEALPWLAPVGRLDKASEGLLLFSNDPEWAARVTDPDTGPDKTYHVQINRIPDAASLAAMTSGVVSEGQTLAAKAVRLLRQGEKNAWLEIVLDEGRNRQIRRLLSAFDIQVLRLLRTAIGGLELGDLAKGQWRWLSAEEAESLVRRGHAPDAGSPDAGMA
jgi:23S rRNA pseudouridine2605 synthase